MTTTAVPATPADPIAAVVHPDPYPYYAALAVSRPLYRDDRLGMWVAAGAREVDAVLASPAVRVRPVDGPLAPHLMGTPAGEVFGHLVRWADGSRHNTMKRAVRETLSGADLPAQVQASARAWTRRLVADGGAELVPVIDRLAYGLPGLTLAELLELGGPDPARTARSVEALAGAVAPTAAAGPAAAAMGEVADLRARALARLADGPASPDLLSALGGSARRQGCADPGAIAANALGLLSQAHQATAALFLLTVAALSGRPDLVAGVRTDAALAADLVRDTARRDPPVHNTRRYLAEDAVIAGERLRAGDTVLVLLAGAGCDPDIAIGSAAWTFGAGPHACPGPDVATAIAGAGIAGAVSAGLALDRLRVTGYRPSPNIRMPVLEADGAG